MKKMQSRKEGEKRVGKLKIERNAVNHRLLKACLENSSKAFAIRLSALFSYMQNIILRTDRVLIYTSLKEIPRMKPISPRRSTSCNVFGMWKETSLSYYTRALISLSQLDQCTNSTPEGECQGNLNISLVTHPIDGPNWFSWSSWLHMGGKMETTAGKGGHFPNCEHTSSCVCL